MEVELVSLILKHGLPIVIMSLIVMCIVGIVKIFTKGITNKKEVSENKKKWLAKIYLVLSLFLSFVVTVFYYCVILKVNCWTLNMVRDAGIVWTVTSPLYQIYKQFGGRKLLTFVVASIQKAIKGKDKTKDAVLEIVMSILTEEAPLLTVEQKANIETNLKSALNGEKKEKEIPEDIKEQ